MTTFTDGAPPSVTPEPDDGSVPHRAGAPGSDADPDAGSAWLHDEIQRRIAEGAAGGGGRHARRGEPTSSSSAGYVPRHSVATPGPGAPRPGPVGGQMSQASELLRRERTESPTQPVWSGPPTRPVESQPGASQPGASQPGASQPGASQPGTSQPASEPSDPDAGQGPVRPGVAAAAAMRGAARGRARAAAAAATPVAPAPPADGGPSPAPDVPAAPPQPSEAPSDPSATAPVETAPPTDAGPPAPDAAAPSAAPTAPLPAPPPPAGPGPAGEPPSRAAQSEAAAPAAPGPTPGLAPPADLVPPPPPAADPQPPPPASADPAAAEHTAPVPPVPAVSPVEEPSGGPAQVDSPPSGITVPEQRGAGLRGSRLPRPDAPDDQASKRVRVVLAERKGVARPVRTVITIQESTGVGELLRSNLIGSQLAIALRFAIGAGLTLGLLPLLFAIVPEIGRVEVLGIRLPWLLLGVLVYPFLFGLGLWHTRTAEHLEQNFAETVQD